MILTGKSNSSNDLDMTFVVTFDNKVGEEFIIRSNVLPLISCPLDILLLPSKAIVVVNQAQYELDAILSCLRHHKIQPLDQKKRERKRIQKSNKNWQKPTKTVEDKRKAV